MARPCILIKKELLIRLHEANKAGVPYSKLVRNYDLTVSQPTLAKLIHYITIAGNSPKEVADIIHASLYPAWSEQSETNCTVQPSTWYYRGKMPLGEWVERQWADDLIRDLEGNESYA